MSNKKKNWGEGGGADWTNADSSEARLSVMREFPAPPPRPLPPINPLGGGISKGTRVPCAHPVPSAPSLPSFNCSAIKSFRIALRDARSSREIEPLRSSGTTTLVSSPRVVNPEDKGRFERGGKIKSN
jgi:hypothetical protein